MRTAEFRTASVFAVLIAFAYSYPQVGMSLEVLCSRLVIRFVGSQPETFGLVSDVIVIRPLYSWKRLTVS